MIFEEEQEFLRKIVPVLLPSKVSATETTNHHISKQTNCPTTKSDSTTKANCNGYNCQTNGLTTSTYAGSKTGICILPTWWQMSGTYFDKCTLHTNEQMQVIKKYVGMLRLTFCNLDGYCLKFKGGICLFYHPQMGQTQPVPLGNFRNSYPCNMVGNECRFFKMGPYMCRFFHPYWSIVWLITLYILFASCFATKHPFIINKKFIFVKKLTKNIIKLILKFSNFKIWW